MPMPAHTRPPRRRSGRARGKASPAATELLVSAYAMLVTSCDAAATLAHIMPDLADAFGVSGYVLYVVDRHNRSRLKLRSAFGLSPQHRAEWAEIELGSHICGEVARDGQPIILHDVQARSDAPTAAVRAMGIATLACHPGVSQGRLMCTLAFFSTARARFPDQAVSLMRDMSHHVAAVVERAQLTQELQESETMLRRGMDAARVGTWDWHVDTDILVTSPGYAATLRGHRDLDLTYSSTAVDTLHPDDRGRVRAVLDQLVADGLSRGDGAFEAGYRVVLPDGAIRWLASRGKVVSTGPDGRATLICGVTIDVTERRLAEEARRASDQQVLAGIEELRTTEQGLREQAALLNALHATARVGLAVQDTALRFTVVNDHFAEFLGMPAAELIGRTRQEVAPEIADQIEPLLRAVLEKGVPIDGVELSVPVRGRAGEKRTCLKSFYPVRDPGGAIVGVGEAVLDMIEKRRADDRARHSERLQTVGRLAAGVAHDFNNILHIVIGNLDLLDGCITSNAESHKLIAMALRAAERGAYLTQQMLSYTRQQILVPQQIDVPAVLSDLRLQLERTLGPRIHLDIRMRRPLPNVITDRAQLETALINLAVNAGHAMPSGGPLVIELYETETADVGEIKAGTYLVIAVSDSGKGIPPDLLDRVFEPFFTTKGLDGTGLGLSMVQGFSRQCGGDTRIFSSPGRGTRVEIWLPASPEHATRAEPFRPNGSRGHILLVDDMPDVLSTTATFLERGRFTVERALDGPQALALVAAGGRFDMLVTDYVMPGMSGVELVERVRSYQPHMPALIITGFSEIMDYVPEEHGTKLLRKPFQPARFLALVNAMVGEYPAVA